MDQASASDAVAALNARAIAMGWGMRCYEDLDFVEPELNAFRDVWRARAGKTGLASRADFDARTLKQFLPHVSLMERVAGAYGDWRYRVRLSGSALSHLLGEQTGRYLDEFIPEPFLERWTAGYDTVLASARPLRVVSRFELPLLRLLDGESILVPLANGSAAPHMILGALYVTHKQAHRDPTQQVA
jgi:hypothetical protein